MSNQIINKGEKLIKNLPILKSVINIDNDSLKIPFITPKLMNMSQKIKTNLDPYALIYPDKIKEFLKNQEEIFKNRNNYELAFAGRSNVGKSSIINSLTANPITKVAKRPGKTNHLQYIYIPDIGVSIVDCPGYGYANKSNKEIKSWGKMIEDYISHGKYMKRIMILVDSDVGIGPQDENCMKMAAFMNKEFNVILTKVDKVRDKSVVEKRIQEAKEIIKKYKFYSQYLFLTSSRTDFGILELRCFLYYINYLEDSKSDSNSNLNNK